MNEANYMQLAFTQAYLGIEKGQAPFGACIVKDNQVIAATHNSVCQDTDSIAHAEINAIREACKTVNSIDLTGAVIYSSTEPCTMCFGAIHWAKIERIIYGATIQDAQSIGFKGLGISNIILKNLGDSKVIITPEFLREEALELFRLWKSKYDPNILAY